MQTAFNLVLKGGQDTEGAGAVGGTGLEERQGRRSGWDAPKVDCAEGCLFATITFGNHPAGCLWGNENPNKHPNKHPKYRSGRGPGQKKRDGFSGACEYF